MATFKKFEDMKIWQDGRDLVKAVYAVAGRGLFAKDFGNVAGLGMRDVRC